MHGAGWTPGEAQFWQSGHPPYFNPLQQYPPNRQGQPLSGFNPNVEEVPPSSNRQQPPRKSPEGGAPLRRMAHANNLNRDTQRDRRSTEEEERRRLKALQEEQEAKWRIDEEKRLRELEEARKRVEKERQKALERERREQSDREQPDEANRTPPQQSVAPGEPTIGEQYIFDVKKKKYFPFPRGDYYDYARGEIFKRRPVEVPTASAATSTRNSWDYPRQSGTTERKWRKPSPTDGTTSGTDDGPSEEELPRKPLRRRNSNARQPRRDDHKSRKAPPVSYYTSARGVEELSGSGRRRKSTSIFNTRPSEWP